MRVLKLIVNALVLLVVLPVSVAAVLGVVFSPLQTSARAVEPRSAFEVSDVMWSASAEPESVPPSESEPEPEPELEPEPEPEPGLEPELGSNLEPGLEPESTRLPEPEPETAVPEVLPAAPGTADGPIEQLDATEGGPETDRQDYYTSDQLRVRGAIYDDGLCYTWYSQRVLPGGGLDIEGRHVSDDGYVVDAQGRIVVASDDLPLGAELDIPFGTGRAVVLDSGCDPGVLDIYTDF